MVHEVLQISSDMRQSKAGKASLALREGLLRRATAQEYLFQVMHVQRKLQR